MTQDDMEDIVATNFKGLCLHYILNSDNLVKVEFSNLVHCEGSFPLDT